MQIGGSVEIPPGPRHVLMAALVRAAEPPEIAIRKRLRS